MENDGISTREGGISGADEYEQTTHDSFRGPHINSHTNRSHNTDAGLDPSEEVTVAAYDSSDPPLRDFPADSSSFLTTLSQMEGASFASEDNSASALALALASAPASGNLNVGDGHEKELHEVEQHKLPQSCRICGNSSTGDSRAMVRFWSEGATATPDISLHVFCGKTASILNSKPHFEILLKAGLKNKHGIGPDVNFALARTRSAVAQGGEADKDPKRLDKEYYLVKEFEGHLSSIRSLQQKRETSITPQLAQMTGQPAPMPAHFFADISPVNPTFNKPTVHKASRNYAMHKYPYKYTQGGGPQVDWANANARDPLASALAFGRDEAHASAYRASDHAANGRVRCRCGGIYNPTKGAGSWKAHVKTKRHTLYESQSHTSSSLGPVGTMLYKDSNNILPIPLSDLNRNNSLGLRHIDEHQGNVAAAHTQSSEERGDYIVHASENQGNHANAQTLTNEDQGNYTAIMPYTSNGDENYTVARPHSDDEQGTYNNEHYLKGTSSIQEGRDVSSKQDEAAEKSRR